MLVDPDPHPCCFSGDGVTVYVSTMLSHAVHECFPRAVSRSVIWRQ